MQQILDLSLLMMIILLPVARSNQFDPHLIPAHGPFFEGWYIRITDDKAPSIRLGLLCAHVIAEEPSSSLPKVVASILYPPGIETTRATLQTEEAFFDIDNLDIKVKGHEVVENPDDLSPANFSWFVSSQTSFANFTVINDTTYFNFDLNNRVILRGKLESHEAWAPGGIGPEGPFIKYFPLPLDWFVYSLRSRVIEYEFINRITGLNIVRSTGVVHMEKNWGRSFPKAWIWSQGTSDTAYIALSGGLVSFAFLDVKAYLIGYRNFEKDIDVNFQPINSLVDNFNDGCQGLSNLVVNSINYKLEINITTPFSYLSKCLYGPMENGFQKACVESYSSTIEIRLYKRFAMFGLEVLDYQVIQDAALEFGGDYVCQRLCSANETSTSILTDFLKWFHLIK